MVDLDRVNAAREAGLASCRRTIRSAGSAIRAVHRLQSDRAQSHLAESEAALREAQRALAPYPMVAYAGFLHDAEKEYAEAALTTALVRGDDLPGREELHVGVPAWLNGLAEAASELRRHLLDRLRAGDTAVAERLLAVMEDVYEALVTVDYPDAVTGGLRRSADALRAVLERTRSDVTTTLMQVRLQAALERRASAEREGSGDGSALA
jgi:translin